MKITHYAYFTKQQEAAAQGLARTLSENGYEAKVDHIDYDGQQTVVIARVEVADEKTATSIEEHIKSLAEEHGGEYDGSETEIDN